MKVASQGFQKFEHEQDRQTDMQLNALTVALVGGNTYFNIY